MYSVYSNDSTLKSNDFECLCLFTVIIIVLSDNNKNHYIPQPVGQVVSTKTIVNVVYYQMPGFAKYCNNQIYRSNQYCKCTPQTLAKCIIPCRLETQLTQ